MEPWAHHTAQDSALLPLTSNPENPLGIRQKIFQMTPLPTFTQQLNEVDRAILEGEDAGFVRVHVAKGTDKIVGATIVATNAGDMISEITLAMTHGLGLKKIGSTIHPYPTQGEAIRKVGDLYNRTRLTPRVKKLFRAWLSWTR